MLSHTPIQEVGFMDNHVKRHANTLKIHKHKQGVQRMDGRSAMHSERPRRGPRASRGHHSASEDSSHPEAPPAALLPDGDYCRASGGHTLQFSFALQRVGTVNISSPVRKAWMLTEMPWPVPGKGP